MADPLYLPPKDAVYQGDIYAEMPSVCIEGRPLVVARRLNDSGGRQVWQVHGEDGPAPPGGFKWAVDKGGETGLLVHAYLGLAMVLSHDCEIENDPRIRTLAMVRPITDLDAASQQALFSGREEDARYGVFPLLEQDVSPVMNRSFVDFRRLTTVRPKVLEASTRVASLSDGLREAIATAFRLYLFRRMEKTESDGA